MDGRGFDEHVKHMRDSRRRQHYFARLQAGLWALWFKRVRGERTHAEDWMNPVAEVKRGEERGGGRKWGWRVGSDGSLWSPSTWISAGINCRIHYQHWKSNEIYKARGPKLRRCSPTAGQGPGMSLAMRCRADGSDRQIAGIRRLDC